MTSANIKEILHSVLKEKGQHEIIENLKLWLLTHKQIFPKVAKSSFYIQREWLEEYEYGKGMFSSEYGVDKNYTSNTMPTAYSCRNIFILFFSPFPSIFYCFFQAMRNGLPRVSMIQIRESKQ